MELFLPFVLKTEQYDILAGGVVHRKVLDELFGSVIGDRVTRSLNCSGGGLFLR